MRGVDEGGFDELVEFLVEPGLKIRNLGFEKRIYATTAGGRFSTSFRW